MKQRWIDLGKTSGLCDKKPEANHLNISMAYVLLVQQNIPPESNSELNCIMKVIQINYISWYTAELNNHSLPASLSSIPQIWMNP
jgi:hypothetical protein